MMPPVENMDQTATRLWRPCFIKFFSMKQGWLLCCIFF